MHQTCRGRKRLTDRHVKKSKYESRGWKIFKQSLAKLSWRQGSSTCGTLTNSTTWMKCIDITFSFSLFDLFRSRLQLMFPEMYMPLAIFGLLAQSSSTSNPGGSRSSSLHILPLPFCLHLSQCAISTANPSGMIEIPSVRGEVWNTHEESLSAENIC